MGIAVATVARRGALLLIALGCLSAVTFGVARSVPAANAEARHAADAPNGKQLFLRDCAVCHGADAGGTNRGPDLQAVGVAAVDFMIRTGRMPLRDPTEKLERRSPKYDEAEIRAIDEYAGTLIEGFDVPSVSIAGTNISSGQKLYLDHCAACHQAVGAGGALAYGVDAPPLSKATPLEVVEAMRIGPGTMPRFDEKTIAPDQARDIARYVKYLHAPQDPGGIDLEHLGPVPEGLVAWVVGLGLLILLARMLGKRAPSKH